MKRMVGIVQQGMDRAAKLRESRHVIADLSFAEGWARCQCGAQCRNDAEMLLREDHGQRYLAPAHSPEALQGAFQAHRSAVGAPPPQPLRTGPNPFRAPIR